MTDQVEAITDAVKQITLQSPVENDSPTLNLLIAYMEQNESAAARSELLSSLLEVVEGENSEDRKLALFQESSLTVLPLLAPLTRNVQTAPVAERLITLACQSARPREAILALGEILEGLEDQTETLEVSDNGEEFDGDDDGEDEGTRMAGLIAELRVVVGAYSIVVPKLPTKRSTPTILRIDNALGTLLSVLSHHTTQQSAQGLLTVLMKLLSVTANWSKLCEDDGGEQNSLLSHTLCVSLTLLGSRVGANMLERWFSRAFPRYATQSEEETEAAAGQKALETALATAEHLGTTRQSLIHSITLPSSIAPHSSLAALILVSTAKLNDDGEGKDSVDTYEAATLLQDSMPVLSAALGGSAVDAGLTWTWEVIHRIPGRALDHDAASMLLEILVPLTAVHPSSQARLALFKLLSRICSVASSPLDEILLLKQLVEPENPFDEIRLAGVSIARERLAEQGQEDLFTPDMLSHLGSCCFSLPPGPEPTLALALPILLETLWPSWFTECLGLFWLLFTVDKMDKTGVRGHAYLDDLAKIWLAPQRRRLVELQLELKADENLQGTADVAFTLERWSEALERVEDAIKS